MADITTHYQDHTLLIRISDTLHAPSAGELFVNLVEILSEAERSEEVRSIVLRGPQGLVGWRAWRSGLPGQEAQAWV